MKEYKNNKKQDTVCLWRHLNLDVDFDYKDIDKAYLESKKNKNTQLAWKVLRDKYFCSEYKKNRSMTRIFEAGFFDDEQEVGFYKSINYQWTKTPIYKIKNNIKKFGSKKRYAVLLTTGAFSPIHKGHILYMEAARDALIKKGISIVGGYISPSHDGYVDLKDEGDARMDAVNRVRLCRKAVQRSNWLMVDAWESLGVSDPVTYTLVYERLKKYLAKKFSATIMFDIYFVVGSDNAAYARVFAQEGYCVCVERYSYKKTYSQIFNEYKNNNKLIFVDYKKEHLKCSSSKIRQGVHSMMDDKVLKHYLKLKKVN